MENTVRERQVMLEITLLEKAIEELSSVIETLQQRLGPILRNADDTCKEISEPQEKLVPLAGFIRNNVLRVGQQTDKLRSILSLLEL